MTDTSVPEPRAFRVDSRDVQGASVIAVAGEVDAHTAPSVRDAVEAAIAPGARVIVDLREVSFLDSIGLGVFVTALKHVREADGTLDLVDTSSRVLKVFELTGLDVVIPIHEELDPLLDS
jgi:anti-sigma B factor antagonist